MYVKLSSGCLHILSVRVCMYGQLGVKACMNVCEMGWSVFSSSRQ